MKTRKIGIKKQREMICAYYREIFAGTEANIVLEEDCLLISLEDYSRDYNKVFARICSREKCDFLRYSMTLTSIFGRPRLELIIEPKYGYLQVQRIHIYLSTTPKNIENFKKFVDEETLQDEINNTRDRVKCLERAERDYRKGKAIWQKFLKSLEAEKEKSPKKETGALVGESPWVDKSFWSYIRELPEPKEVK